MDTIDASVLTASVDGHNASVRVCSVLGYNAALLSRWHHVHPGADPATVVFVLSPAMGYPLRLARNAAGVKLAGRNYHVSGLAEHTTRLLGPKLSNASVLVCYGLLIDLSFVGLFVWFVLDLLSQSCRLAVHRCCAL
jgi:hypothetical protein